MRGLHRLSAVSLCALLLAACGSGGGATTASGSGGGGPSAAAASGEAQPSASALGTVTVSTDDAAAVEHVIGADGGSLTAKAADGTTFTLTVPQGALPSDTTVRAVPATLEGVDFPTYTVMFGPTGTQFTDWATLAITLPTEVPLDEQFLYQLNDDATEFSAAFVDPKAKAPTIYLDHFSGYGLGQATDAQQAAVLSKSAASAEARIQSEFASILGQERQNQLLGAGEDSSIAEQFDTFSKQYEEEVIKPRLAAAGASCESMQEAIRTVLGFERQKQLLGVGGDSSDGMQVLQDALNANGGPCEKEAIEKCKAAKDPGILLRYWLGIERQKQLLGMSEGEGLDIGSLIKKARSICAPKSYDVDAMLPSSPSGITVKGLICSLAEPFSLRLGNDIIGRLKFTPASEEAGAWAFKGKVGNAPFSVDGSGNYTVAMDESTGLATAIDFPFTLTVHIPVVGDQTTTVQEHLPLTATEPCAEQQ